MSFFKIFLLHDNYFGRRIMQTVYVSADTAQSAVDYVRLEYTEADNADIVEVWMYSEVYSSWYRIGNWK